MTADSASVSPPDTRNASRVPPETKPGGFVRAFIAIELNDGTRNELMRVEERLRRTQAHVGWVPWENLHLSLAFLGDITAGTVEAVAGLLDEAAGASAPFSFNVRGVGAFGRRTSPRILWAGAEPAEPIQVVRDRMAAGLEDLGVPFDRKVFRPHVTLGRARSPRGREELVRALALPEVAGRDFGTVRVDHLVLMQSELRPSGARYTPLHTALLLGRSRDGEQNAPCAGDGHQMT